MGAAVHVRRNLLVITAAAIAPLLLAAAGGGTQGAKSVAGARVGSQEAKTLAAFEAGPYTADPEQAIVGIEVTDTSADGASRQTRRGTGLVVRFDGYILAPQSLFSYRIDSTKQDAAEQTVTVTLHPGADSPIRVLTHRPHYFGKIPVSGLLSKRFPLGYTVMKLDNICCPALRLLRPETLNAPSTIDVFWAPFDETTSRFGPVQHRGASLAAPERYTKDSPPGTLYLAEKQTGLPAGAVAVGPESFGIGLMDGPPENVDRDAITDFAVLEYATNCVTPVPTTDADFRKLSEKPGVPDPDAAPAGDLAANPAPPPPGMLRIPGGPVRLPDAVRALQPEMGLATVACVAPFLMDRSEVTNAEYLAYWKTLPAKDQARDSFKFAYYPAGWAESGLPFPAEIAGLPVLGVRLPGAEGYARAHGKRLPTPAEWCRAAFGPRGDLARPDWVVQYIADRRQTWERVALAHDSYLRTHQDMTVDPDRATRARPYTIPYRILPWFFSSPDLLAASTWSQHEIEEDMAHLWAQWKDPIYVLPSGSREFDKSPYGVPDMILNGGEMVAPLPDWPDRQDIRNTTPNYFIEIYWTDYELRANGPPKEMPLLGGWAEFYPPYSPTPQPEMSVLPLLSRLVKPPSVPVGSEFDYSYGTVLGSSIYEVNELLRPISDWEVRMIPGPYQDRFPGMNAFYGWPKDPWIIGMGDLTVPARFSAAYALWRGMPHHYHREMGRDIPLGEPRSRGSILPTEAALPAGTYLLPGGFRCVR